MTSGKKTKTQTNYLSTNTYSPPLKRMHIRRLDQILRQGVPDFNHWRKERTGILISLTPNKLKGHTIEIRVVSCNTIRNKSARQAIMKWVNRCFTSLKNKQIEPTKRRWCSEIFKSGIKNLTMENARSKSLKCESAAESQIGLQYSEWGKIKE